MVCGGGNEDCAPGQWWGGECHAFCLFARDEHCLWAGRLAWWTVLFFTFCFLYLSWPQRSCQVKHTFIFFFIFNTQSTTTVISGETPSKPQRSYYISPFVLKVNHKGHIWKIPSWGGGGGGGGGGVFNTLDSFFFFFFFFLVIVVQFGNVLGSGPRKMLNIQGPQASICLQASLHSEEHLLCLNVFLVSLFTVILRCDS